MAVFSTGMAVPAAVDRQNDGQTITKTYELAPDENPELLIEEPFEQDGLCYEYAQMTGEPVETTEKQDNFADRHGGNPRARRRKKILHCWLAPSPTRQTGMQAR